MKKAGVENQDYYSGLYKWIDQSVMGIKEIKIANRKATLLMSIPSVEMAM